MAGEGFAATIDGLEAWLSKVAADALADDPGLNVDRSEFQALIDQLPVAILIGTNRDCARIVGNAAAYQLFGLPVGANFSPGAPEGDRPPYEIYTDGVLSRPEDLPMQVAARSGRPVANSECEVRFADSRRLFLAGHSIPIRNASGHVCGSIGTFIDLTRQKQELEVARVLSREMSHRLKNTVAMIQAISRRTVRPLIPQDAYNAYEERLLVLSRFQDLLVRENLAQAELAEIVEQAIGPVAQAMRDRVSSGGPAVVLPSHETLAISMVLHELATNSCKYGALSGSSGHLQVSWTTDRTADARNIALDWIESGGPAVPAPTKKGFGTELMAKVCGGLPGGRIDFDFAPTGLKARICFGLPAAG